MSTPASDHAETPVGDRHGVVAGERWTYEIVRVQRVPQPLDEVFAFFADARNLERFETRLERGRTVQTPGDFREWRRN